MLRSVVAPWGPYAVTIRRINASAQRWACSSLRKRHIASPARSEGYASQPDPPSISWKTRREST